MATASELVAEASKLLTTLDPIAVNAHRADADVVLVDVREPDEVTTGVIPGAIAIPRGLLEFRCDPASPGFDERLTRDASIVLYCASGGRSALAGATLVELGYTDVAHLGGGIAAWRDAGLGVDER